MRNLFGRFHIQLLFCTVFLLLPLPLFAQSDSGTPKTSAQQQDGQRDFDFEFGEWKIQLKRRLRPLTGSTSTTWVDYEGTSIVRRVWNGAANLGELNVSGSAGQIHGLSLRTYNPQTQQWNINWSNRADGTVGPPMIGGFKSGRGEFYNQELFNGRAIFVRFIFSDITANTFRFEQAFSADGGKTWEANWIATFSRVKD